jgi:hypothetical protein
LEELLADTEGCVVEVGAGTGANLPAYPGQGGELIAVEPEPRLRKLATQATTEAPTPVEVREGEPRSCRFRTVPSRES